MNNKDFKKAAKEQIKGQILMLFAITLIISAIYSVVSVIPVVGQIGIFFVAGALNISLYKIYLNLTKGQSPQLEDIKIGLDQWKEGTILFFFMGLFTFLWSLLFLIPGIIKMFAYSQATYILAENPGMSGRQALKESIILMKGHKMEFFLLSLSFIWWNLLAACTCGLLYIWLAPYMSATFANYYNYLKGDVVSAA